MIYPNERDIQEFMAKLPCENVEEFKPLVEEAQREYRRARLKDPANEEGLISILSGHAGDVFKTLVARRLKARSGDFVSFQREISSEGGDAETAMWFAHDLYRLSGDGRMLAVWHRQIEPKVWRLERQAADMWWLPDVLPPGWEEFLPQVSAGLGSPNLLTQQEEGCLPKRSEEVAPGLLVASTWEDLEVRFLSDERVQTTVGDRTETRNYAEMGFLDTRTDKPNLAWGMLRCFAENYGVLRDAKTAGARWVQVEKRVQEIRKLLRRIHDAPGDPLPLVKGAGYQARFRIRCTRSYST